jgi:Flp pilus assembly protein TadD
MSDLQEQLGEALELGDEGRWEEMADTLTRALREFPDDPYVLCWLGVAHRELGHDSIASDFFKRCWQQEPLDPELLAMCGAGLAAFDDPDAEAALRAAALSGPNVAIARLQYGAYLAREGMFEAAFENLQAARELEPDDPAVAGELGIAYALKGDYPHAAQAFEQTLSLAPDDSWTRVLLGLVYSELNDDEQAAETLLAAAEQRLDDAEAQILAALAAAAVEWTDIANTVLEKASYSEEGFDPELMEEARERLDEEDAAATRAFLHEHVAPAALHDRLLQPI